MKWSQLKMECRKMTQFLSPAKTKGIYSIARSGRREGNLVKEKGGE